MAEFRELAKGVYAFVQPPLIWYGTCGVIVGEKDVIVIDSLTNAAMAGELRSCIRKVTDKPIRFLINTHEHPDHVYTNHLFPEATSIIAERGREKTKSNLAVQSRHNELFAKIFPEVDFSGGRYTLQDMSFTGRLTLYQGSREIRLLELGPGHSESDVVVHLPGERIVFCGDVYFSGLPPLPSEGHVTHTIENYKKIEALEADIYVAGHGAPGTLLNVREQRRQLERLFQHSAECYRKGLEYDVARQNFEGDSISPDFKRAIIFSCYWEFLGHAPRSNEPETLNHLNLLRGIANEAERRFAGFKSAA